MGESSNIHKSLGSRAFVMEESKHSTQLVTVYIGDDPCFVTVDFLAWICGWIIVRTRKSKSTSITFLVSIELWYDVFHEILSS
jgi:hypothetical protein